MLLRKHSSCVKPSDTDDRLTQISRSLQAAQQELERQQNADALKKNLEKRPDRDTLVERRTQSNCGHSHAVLTRKIGNILSDSTAAPALQANQRSLEKHMRADSLEHKIQHRPKPEDLVKEGILEADENPLQE
jgi:RPEL repeat